MLPSQGALLLSAALLLCSTASATIVIHKTYSVPRDDPLQPAQRPKPDPVNKPEAPQDNVPSVVPAPQQYGPPSEHHPPKPQPTSTAQHPYSPFSAYPYHPYVPVQYPNYYPAQSGLFQPSFFPTVASIFQRFPFFPHFPYYQPYQVSHYYNVPPSQPAVRPQPAHHASPEVQQPDQEPTEVPASPKTENAPEPSQETPTGQTGTFRSNYPHGGYHHGGYPHGGYPNRGYPNRGYPNRRRPGYPHYPYRRYPYRPRGYFYEPVHPVTYFQAVHDGPHEPTVMYNAPPEPVPPYPSYDPLQRGAFESFLQAILRIIGAFMVPGSGGGDSSDDADSDANGTTTTPDGSLYVSVRNTSGPVKVTLAVAEVPAGIHAVTDLKLNPEVMRANPAFYNALFGARHPNLNRPAAAAAEPSSDLPADAIPEEAEPAEEYDILATAERDPPSSV